jgi:hypothetical protein
MGRWPDFFIAGAQRAGTTSLYEYLNAHPDVFMPEVKEPHFFCEVAPGGEALLRSVRSRVISNEQDYLALFDGAAAGQIAGEATPFYMYDADAPGRIKARVSDAKIIALLRDPIERAHSNYMIHTVEGWETRTFPRAVREDYASERKGLGVSHLYVEIGLYAEQVERYFETFGRESVRVYLYDDLIADPARVVEDACAFLELPFLDGAFCDFEKKHGAYQVPRNAAVKWLMGNVLARNLAISLLPQRLLAYLRDHVLFSRPPRPAIEPEARALLHDIFSEDVARLARLIDRNLDDWLN